MKIFLLHQDQTVEKDFELKSPQTSLGREVDNDVHLLVPGISRYHCVFEYDGFEWRIRDLGSTNGTVVNGQPISEARVLRSGDMIDIGDQLVRFGEAMSGISAPTEIRQISIFDSPVSTEGQNSELHPRPQIIIPAEEEIEAATATVIELPEETEMPETPDISVPVPPPVEPEFPAAPSGNEYNVTETVKTNVPLFDLKATTSGSTEQPKIIINLPGQAQSNDAGKIVFEPFNDEPSAAPAAETPASPPELPPILTPAPETMRAAAPPAEMRSAPSEKSKEAAPGPAAPPEESPSATVKSHVDLKLFDKVSLFGGQKEPHEHPGNTPPPSKRKMSNLLFYTLLLCSATIFVTIFIKLQQNTKAAPPPKITLKRPETPLLLVYEKKIIAKDNIFNFTMTLEGNAVHLTLDDLRSQRHYIREDKKIKPELVAELLQDVKNTDFMGLPAQTAGSPRDGVDEFRRLTIGYDQSLKTIVIENNFAPSSFEKIEQAINDFAEEYGLQTIALTPEELKREAEVAFNKAEELFQNRDADPQNLNKAIKRYQLTVDYLDQFAPRPRQWDLARKRLVEAREMIAKRLQDLKFDFQRQYRLQEYGDALKTADQIISLLDPNSKEYERYRSYRAKLEAKIRKDR